MKWTKLIVDIHPMAVEALSNFILEYGIEGIEIDDQFLSTQDGEAMHVGYVDASIQALDEHKVIAYLDETQDTDQLKSAVENELIRLKTFIEVGSGLITIEEMPDENYAHKWKEHYQAFRVGENMVVTPVWIEPEVSEGDIVIKIDPGLAFGSGTHETTSLVMDFLQDMDVSGKEVIDLGCGSGILAIAAAKMGAKKAIGIDIDQNAVTIAKENILHNGVEAIVEIREGNLLEQVNEKADLLVANILADVIILVASDVKTALKSGGTFIASGIIEDKAKEVVEHLKKLGYYNITKLQQGEWVAYKAMV